MKQFRNALYISTQNLICVAKSCGQWSRMFRNFADSVILSGSVNIFILVQSRGINLCSTPSCDFVKQPDADIALKVLLIKVLIMNSFLKMVFNAPCSDIVPLALTLNASATFDNFVSNVRTTTLDTRQKVAFHWILSIDPLQLDSWPNFNYHAQRNIWADHKRSAAVTLRVGTFHKQLLALDTWLSKPPLD